MERQVRAMTLGGGIVEIPPVQALLEAGEERSTLLLAAIARRLAELSPGQVLEVTSQAGNARIDAVAWCHVTGHELVALLTEGPTTRFWIRKVQT